MTFATDADADAAGCRRSSGSSPTSRRWRSIGRGWRRRPPSASEWFERLAHTDPLTGLANLRTISRVLELELARAGRQGSEVSVAIFDVDDFAADERAGGPRGRRRRPALGRVGPRGLRPPRRHGRPVRRRTSSCSSRRARPARWSPSASWRASPSSPVAGRTISVTAGVARFPQDGTDAEAVIDAARAALDRARPRDAAASRRPRPAADRPRRPPIEPDRRRPGTSDGAALRPSSDRCRRQRLTADARGPTCTLGLRRRPNSLPVHG